MKKLFLVLIVIALVAATYTIFSDPEKKSRFLGTIEGSTGVDLASEPQQIIEDTGRVVGDAAQQVLKDLGDTLTDPAFYKSLEKWGRDALDKLDEAELEGLKKELERESRKSEADYDEILGKYLNGLGES